MIVRSNLFLEKNQNKNDTIFHLKKKENLFQNLRIGCRYSEVHLKF